MFSEDFYSDITVQSGKLAESVFSCLSDWNDYLSDSETYTPEDLYKTAFFMCYIDKVLKQREKYPNSFLADLSADTLTTLSDFRDHFHFILMSFDETGYISQLDSDFLKLRVESHLSNLDNLVDDRAGTTGDAVSGNIQSYSEPESNSESDLTVSKSEESTMISLKDFSDEFLMFLHLVRVSSKSYVVVQPESDISDSLLHGDLLSENDVITEILSFYPFRLFHNHLNVYGFLNHDVSLTDFLISALNFFNSDSFDEDDIEFFKAYFDEILNLYLLRHPVYSKLKLVTEKPLTLYNLLAFQPELSFEMYTPLCLSTLVASLTLIHPSFSLFIFPVVLAFTAYSTSCLSVLKVKNKDLASLLHFFNVLLDRDDVTCMPTSLLFLLESYFQELFQFEHGRTFSALLTEPYRDLFLLFVYTRTNIKSRFVPTVFKKIGATLSSKISVSSSDSVTDAFLLELFLSEDFSRIRYAQDFHKTAFYHYWKQLYSNPETRQSALNGLQVVSRYFLNLKCSANTLYFPPLASSYAAQHFRLFLDDLTKLCETPLALSDSQASANINTCLPNKYSVDSFVSVRENNIYIEKLLMKQEPIIAPGVSNVSDTVSKAIKDLCLESELKPYLERLNTDTPPKFSVLKSVSDKLKSFLVVTPETENSLKSCECVFDKSDRSLIRDYLVFLSQKDSVSKELLDDTLINLLTDFLFVFPFLQNHLLMLIEMLRTTLTSYSDSAVFDLHSQPFFDFIINFRQSFKNTLNLESQLMLFVGIERCYYSYSRFISSDISDMLTCL